VTRAFIGVGSNLGERAGWIERAGRLLNDVQGIEFIRQSPVIETEPVGGPPQGKYLNAVWEIRTVLAPAALLEHLRTIEKILGRERREANAPRTIDLDLLFYGDRVIEEPDLKVPHPRLHERRFVLEPMAALAPDWRHPEMGRTVQTLLEELP